MNMLQAARLPFGIAGRSFSQLSERDRSFFVGDEYLPLHQNHDAQIVLLDRKSATRVKSFARAGLSKDCVGDLARFPTLDRQFLHDKWNSDAGVKDVRQWLHSLGIPFARVVVLWYDSAVVLTTWKLLIRYWDAFAWSVGVAMYAFDHTLSWVCEFHHEDIIQYYAFPSSKES